MTRAVSSNPSTSLFSAPTKASVIRAASAKAWCPRGRAWWPARSARGSLPIPAPTWPPSPGRSRASGDWPQRLAGQFPACRASAGTAQGRRGGAAVPHARRSDRRERRSAPGATGRATGTADFFLPAAIAPGGCAAEARQAAGRAVADGRRMGEIRCREDSGSQRAGVVPVPLENGSARRHWPQRPYAQRGGREAVHGRSSGLPHGDSWRRAG